MTGDTSARSRTKPGDPPATHTYIISTHLKTHPLKIRLISQIPYIIRPISLRSIACLQCPHNTLELTNAKSSTLP
ncbi:uncharacterized protein EKO05_0002767 [Ascochyta rabiei]|uniref:uncharacterized protein n=1 Tax=Didymella rabiei TaxID=5454 RepID=UPI0022084A31|nr:uncharacterized protein EKO05_0002767 [Ascochyta rabiei]UPX12204.1 hypothetical protein EKO05_0002767 [Ascochyta rabiei]